MGVCWQGPCQLCPTHLVFPYPSFPMREQELWVMKREERMSVAVAGAGGCDLLTISPLAGSGRSAVRVAPIGLTGMLNCGGAVLSCRAGELAGAVGERGGLKAGPVRLRWERLLPGVQDGEH